MTIITSQEKFASALGEIYDAERRFLLAQQSMLQQATHDELRQMLEQHIGETEQQIQNLEKVCDLMGLPTAPVPASDAEGIVRHAEQLLAQVGPVPALCDCVISDAQAKVEHFEIACYRALVVGAQAMGQDDVAQLLEQNLQQEEQMAERVEGGARSLADNAVHNDAKLQERGEEMQ